MGSLYSYLKDDFVTMSTVIREVREMNFRREQDYSALGLARPSSKKYWLKQMRCMTVSELPTRRLLFPVIHERIVLLQMSQKYSAARCQLHDFMIKYPLWNEERFYEIHDLFQGLDIGGANSGLIDIRRLTRGLDLLSDLTPIPFRIEQFTKFDDDVRYIHYEKFIKAIYDLDTNVPKTHLLNKSIKRTTIFLNWNRSMSNIQKFRKGLI